MRARELELQRESWRVRSKELDVERDLKIKAGAGKTRAGWGRARYMELESWRIEAR